LLQGRKVYAAGLLCKQNQRKKGRKGKERKGKERKGKERKGKERTKKYRQADSHDGAKEATFGLRRKDWTIENKWTEHCNTATNPCC